MEKPSQNFELFVSEAVILEISQGDTYVAQERLSYLLNLSVLRLNGEIKSLAKKIAVNLQLPPSAQLDAVHMATAAVHGMQFLLTWNCRHIANAILAPKIKKACEQSGFSPPTICTPPELIRF